MNFLIDLTKIKSKKTYVFEPIDEKLVIYEYNSDDDLIGEFKFNSFTNKDSEHNLPFEFNFGDNFRSGVVNSIEILPLTLCVKLISKTTIEKARSNGDQLRISITSSKKLMKNTLILL